SVFLVTIVVQVNLLVDSLFASNLGEGTISALRYAGNLMVLGPNIVIQSVLTVLFPTLSEQKAKKETASFKSVMERAVRAIAFLAFPMTVCVLVMAKPIIRLLLEHGQFDTNATELTATALVFYSIGIIGIVINMTLKTGLFALGKAITLVWVGLIVVAANIAGNFLLIPLMGYAGIALSTSLVVVLQSFLLVLIMRRNIGPLAGSKAWKGFARILSASAGMAGAMILAREMIPMPSGLAGRPGLILHVGIVVAVGYVSFLFFSFLLRVEELGLLKDALRFRKRQQGLTDAEGGKIV
ncbi:MAG: polysaccharide biosynthesis C-terminal domain-containing protein, partial [Planctomycetes bacterium]|nr:polysaccharide biosynthesis C-terminal domain-containing protein [Planctomycetota bacterium]